MKPAILLLIVPVVALAACGSGDNKAASTTAAPVVTTATPTTEATTAPPTTAPTTAAPTTVATTAAPTTAAPTAATYPAGSNKDDGKVDAAEADLIRSDLRSQNYKVVPDMFTDDKLQALATESCARYSQYNSWSEFYGAEFPAVAHALGIDSNAVMTVEVDTNWQMRALLDATSTACGTDIARIISTH